MGAVGLLQVAAQQAKDVGVTSFCFIVSEATKDKIWEVAKVIIGL